VKLGRWPLAGLGPSGKRGAGGREKETGRVHGRPRRAELGRKPKEVDFPFLFLFQFFKTIFQKILKSILNLIQTTQYKISNAAA
jgi:hypothetical protein